MVKKIPSVVKLSPSLISGAHNIQVQIENLYRQVFEIDPDQESEAEAVVRSIRNLEQQLMNINEKSVLSLAQAEQKT